MAKLVTGVVFARIEDEEYEGMARIWVRDAEDAYWFSLSRAIAAVNIQLMVSDQLTHECDVLDARLEPNRLCVRVDSSAARSLDGHLEYTIAFHPDSDSLDAIAETLCVIFRGKERLVLAPANGSRGLLPA